MSTGLCDMCDMGVGCEEAGVCYAAAVGEPERCGRGVIEPPRAAFEWEMTLARAFLSGKHRILKRQGLMHMARALIRYDRAITGRGS